MGWYKQHTSFQENPFNKPLVDKCINCGQHKEIKTNITMQFSEWEYSTGPICRDCFYAYNGPITMEV